jgi:hypothetical protein
MPIYVYETILEDGEGGEQFEVRQSMSDEPLAEHPTTGEPVRRVIQAPNIGGRHSEAGIKNRLDDNERLEKLGFTKYEKIGKGAYEKRAGAGPRTISAE